MFYRRRCHAYACYKLSWIGVLWSTYIIFYLEPTPFSTYMQYIWKYLLLTFDEVIIVCGGRGRYNSTWKYCHGVVVSIHMSNIVLSNNKLHLICILWIWLLVCISQYFHLSLLVDVSPWEWITHFIIFLIVKNCKH